MPEKESKLKLIHLVYGLISAGVLVGIAIGALMNQQNTNTEEIKTKVDTPIFIMHQEQQREQFESTNKTLDKMDKKLDAIQEKL